MEIIVKKSGIKVDPKRPESHPGYADAVRKAEISKRSMKFESKGEHDDYVRMVKSNPNNIYGLPTFYPPEKIQMFMHGLPTQEERQEWVEKYRRRLEAIRDVKLFCTVCDAVTEHAVSDSGGFCKRCGTQKQLRQVWL